MPKKPATIPHVSWREGRPRFSPGPRLRALGHAGRDLRHPDGRWYTRGEAVDWSDAFTRQLAADAAKARKSQAAGRNGKTGRVAASGLPLKGRDNLLTLEAMFEAWFRSSRFQPGREDSYARRTVEDYQVKARAIRRHDAELYGSAVVALTRPICRGVFEALRESTGLATARGAMLALSAAVSWAQLTGRLPEGFPNPAMKLQMPGSNRRERFGTREEVAALVAAADALGWPWAGDMIVLGVWTGQRQADRLAFVDRGLFRGRRQFRQSKTGAIVEIPDSPMLAARLAAAAQRRAAAGVVSPVLVLDERTWRPMERRAWNEAFGAVKARAIADAAKAGSDTLADLATLHDGDFRRTAVTWLAMAGCTIPQICAITGHTLASATEILQHYLVLNPAMADTAIGQLVTWYDSEILPSGA